MYEAGHVRAMMAAVVRMTMVFLVLSRWLSALSVAAATVFYGFSKFDREFVHTSSGCLHAVRCEGAAMLPSRMALLTTKPFR